MKTFKQSSKFPAFAFPEPIDSVLGELEVTQNLPKAFVGTAMLYAASLASRNSRLVSGLDGPENSSVFCAIVGRSGIGKTPAAQWALRPLDELHEKSNQLYFYTAIGKGAMHNVFLDAEEGIGLENQAWHQAMSTYRSTRKSYRINHSWMGIDFDMSRGKKSYYVQHPFLSLFAEITPDFLKEAIRRWQDSSFMNRHLIAYLPNFNALPWEEFQQPSFNLESEWAKIINRIAAMERIDWDNRDAFTLGWEPDAWEIALEFNHRNTDAINAADSNTEREIRGRFEIYALRLGLILELMRESGAESQAISAESARGAVALCDYYIHQNLEFRGISNVALPAGNTYLITKNYWN